MENSCLIQDINIKYKMVEEENNKSRLLEDTKERSIIIFGSKGVVSLIIYTQ